MYTCWSSRPAPTDPALCVLALRIALNKDSPLSTYKNVTAWVIIAVVTLGLGTIGFHALSPNERMLSAMFSAVQLFALNSGDVAGPVPLPLEVARWLAVMLSTVAFYSLAKNLAADWITGLRLGLDRTVPFNLPFGLRKRRAVVFGLGRKGMSLIEDLRAQRNPQFRVLGIDRDPERVIMARNLGVDAITGDATSEQLLLRLPWQRTDRAILLMGGDTPNLTVALGLARIRGDAAMQVAVHVPTLHLRELMARQNALTANGFRSFNYYERLARRTLMQYPVEAIGLRNAAASVHTLLGLQGVATTGNQVPHIFVRPSRDFTPALVASLARNAHFPKLPSRQWTRIVVVIVGEDAESQRTDIQRLYPALRRRGEHALIDFEIQIPREGQSPAQAMAERIRGLPHGTPSTVFLDVHDAGVAWIEALTLLDGLGVTAEDAAPKAGLELRCVFDFAEEQAIVAFAKAHPGLGRYLLPLPSMGDCLGVSVLFGAEDDMDVLARLFHEQWSEKQPKEERLSWESLTLEMQDQNRAVADHMGVKVRQLRASGIDSQSGDYLRDPEMLELLAECEHRRWAAQKLMTGWEPDATLGEGKNMELKRHGCLDRRYDQLSEGMRENDRENVRMMKVGLEKIERSADG